ncbi:hypothetical protein CLF_111355 [Clonorchis sinensis]|uniref:Uncharacterized protein n=1 Tax=Clonorchis sinensis TaxID=79923 RepID=G7YUP7_CLOSI|nr:hypothetical protein CLF_111355 [Clonorchis sinensis]
MNVATLLGKNLGSRLFCNVRKLVHYVKQFEQISGLYNSVRGSKANSSVSRWFNQNRQLLPAEMETFRLILECRSRGFNIRFQLLHATRENKVEANNYLSAPVETENSGAIAVSFAPLDAPRRGPKTTSAPLDMSLNYVRAMYQRFDHGPYDIYVSCQTEFSEELVASGTEYPTAHIEPVPVEISSSSQTGERRELALYDARYHHRAEVIYGLFTVPTLEEFLEDEYVCAGCGLEDPEENKGHTINWICVHIVHCGERQLLNDKNKTDPGNLGESLAPVYQSVNPWISCWSSRKVGSKGILRMIQNLPPYYSYGLPGISGPTLDRFLNMPTKLPIQNAGRT